MRRMKTRGWFKLFITVTLCWVLLPATAQTLVKDINIGVNGSNPSHFCRMGKFTYFIADDGLHGYELWATDGTEEGTALIKDIAPGQTDGCRYGSTIDHKITDIQTLGKHIYFFAFDGEHGFELWQSDGTANGTNMLKDIYAGPMSSCVDPVLVKMGNNLYFAAHDGTGMHGTELWRTDGTDTGTVLVKDLNPGIKDGSPSLFYVDSTALYFVANDGVSGYGLWKSDGTEAGTIYLKNVAPKPADGYPLPYAKCNGEIYYPGYTFENGVEIWKTNGTPGGTVLVKDIRPGMESSDPRFLATYNNHVVFAASTDSVGFELWQTDGTPNGTGLIKDIYPGRTGSNPHEIIALGSKAFFVATDTTNLPRLFQTDLTDTGTYLLKEAGPLKTEPEKPLGFFKWGSILFFAASSDRKGNELWQTDGTPENTRMLPEACAGICSADPDNLFISDTTLFFAATDEAHGHELFRLQSSTNILKEIIDQNHLGVYVDPLRRQLSVMTQTGNDITYLKVFDLRGNELLKQDVKDPIPTSVDSFPNGIYLLRAYDKNDRVVAFTRFVKE